MALIEWGPRLETGIQVIDFQHLKLVTMINGLGDLNTEPEGPARDLSIRIFLEQIIDYTVYHFNTEESLMTQVEFEHFSSHKQAHEGLKITALSVLKKLEDGEKVYPLLMDFLKNWVQHHIMVVDMQFVPAMKKLIK